MSLAGYDTWKTTEPQDDRCLDCMSAVCSCDEPADLEDRLESALSQPERQAIPVIRDADVVLAPGNERTPMQPTIAEDLRYVIAGPARTGKTTLAAKLCDQPLSTDDLVGLDWSDVSAEAAKQFDVPGPWLLEGVRAVHALRKWMFGDVEAGLAPHAGKPCDVVIWLSERRVPFENNRQVGFAKGIARIWAEVEPELVARGVDVRHGEPARIVDADAARLALTHEVA